MTTASSNVAPIAIADGPQSLEAGGTVTLDGSRSSDANGDALTYSWYLVGPAGSSARLTSSNSVKPTFYADIPGNYTASLFVIDGKINSPPTSVRVTVTETLSPSLILSKQVPPFLGDGFFVTPWLQSLIALNEPNCIGPCGAIFDIATFKLEARGQNYTITSLQAENYTAGLLTVPRFSGLANGQIIEAGQAAIFKIQSPHTGGNTANLNYSFTVKETGQNFIYTVQVRTN